MVLVQTNYLTFFPNLISLDNLLGATYQRVSDAVDGISNSLANRILKKIDEYQQFSNKIENEVDKLDKLDGNWITFWSEDYPKTLKNIFAPPLILYYKGKYKAR